MSGAPRFSRKAERDLARHIAYIRSDSPRSAARFVAAVRRTVQLLCKMPRIASFYDESNPEFEDVRWFNVSRFKTYLIFFREIPDGIEVVRILSGYQDIPQILGVTPRDRENR